LILEEVQELWKNTTTFTQQEYLEAHDNKEAAISKARTQCYKEDIEKVSRKREKSFWRLKKFSTSK
jgi:ElaB/YqjD/DUF883 family membrane-anchored ribosome-binding protein